jgi:hypothetical protein
LLQAKGTAVPNFVTNLLDGRKVSPEEEEEIKWAASSLYSGGADTVRSFRLSSLRIAYYLSLSFLSNSPSRQ